jgi:RNAse (barnase) inhibitor barstar
MATEYVLDGSRIDSLEAFYDEISRVMIPDRAWGRNLDSFNDILWGDFRTPAEGFTIKWSHSATSRQRLGYAETTRQLEYRLARCHPTNREDVQSQLADARTGVGPTVFDWLVEIIMNHGPNGKATGKIQLILD